MRREPPAWSREYKLSEFGPGPWVDEPDTLTWEDPSTGFGRLIRRTEMGSLCGYIALPELHVWTGRLAQDIDASVHGGLTFAEPGINLFHPGDRRWTIGFDCTHYMDIWPSMAKHFASAHAAIPDGDLFKPVYRDIRYVRTEIESLALQAHIEPSWVSYRLRDAAARSRRKKRQARVYAALAKRIRNRKVERPERLDKRRRKSLESWRRTRPAPALAPAPPPTPFDLVGPQTEWERATLKKFTAEWLAAGLTKPEQ